MDNNLIEIISSLYKQKDTPPVEISQELKNQYPYGEFPIKYTRHGQEEIRKHSENRFLVPEPTRENKNTDLNIMSLLPLLQLLGGKKNSKDMMQILSGILFKDNPEMQKLFKLIPSPNKEIKKSSSDFPDTNKVNISSLQRVD